MGSFLVENPKKFYFFIIDELVEWYNGDKYNICYTINYEKNS